MTHYRIIQIDKNKFRVDIKSYKFFNLIPYWKTQIAYDLALGVKHYINSNVLGCLKYIKEINREVHHKITIIYNF